MGGRSVDRARGALVGLAVGDAVGTTLEFQPPGSFEPITDLVGGGPFDLEPGQWTDDTSLALCLADSIVTVGGMDLVDQLQRYVRWRDEGLWSSNGRCFDIGGTTSAQLRRFERTGAPVDPSPDEASAANGSLMRLAPVPIAWHRSVAEAAERAGESSRTTHAATRPVDCCRLYGAMVAAVIGGATLDEVLAPSFWQWGELHPEVAAIAAGSYRTKEPPEIRGSGYCIEALEAALWAVAGADSYRDAVLRAANLGDDADTTAAIAGQLAGAWWGLSRIPREWVVEIALVEEIVDLADRLHRCFDPDAAAGAPPTGVAGARWSHDVVVHGWWVAPGDLLAGEYPIDRAGSPTKLRILVDAGIRTFVDLTTPADRLLPYEATMEELASERSLALRRASFPIPDVSVIAVEGYTPIVDLIDAEIAEGRPVFVHCWGGVGRTGTVIGCWLVRHGRTPDEALAEIEARRAGTRKAHRRAPEAKHQIQMISTWAALDAGRRPHP